MECVPALMHTTPQPNETVIIIVVVIPILQIEEPRNTDQRREDLQPCMILSLSLVSSSLNLEGKTG
jgi:hypothetical protein